MVVAGLLWIFLPSRMTPERVGILVDDHSITTKQFSNGLQSVLAKQGYYKGVNLDLFIENIPRKWNIDLIQNQIFRRKTDMLVVMGDNFIFSRGYQELKRPVIFAFINNPVADNARKAIERERFVTGVSYFPPYQRTFELSKKVIGDYHTLTLLLPQNSKWNDYDRVAAAAADNHLKIRIVTFSPSELSQIISNLAGETGAIYLPADNYFIQEHDGIEDILQKSSIPVISSNLIFCNVAVLSCYAEPETMGEIAGEIIVKIFHGADPEFMPVELSTDYKLIINLKQIQKLKIPIHEDVLSYANRVIQ